MVMVSLFCLLRDQGSRNTFVVNVEKTMDVSCLREIIKQKKSVELANVDASNLILYDVSLPLVDLDARLDGLELASYPILSPTTKLSSISSATWDNRLHILIDWPSEPTLILSCGSLCENQDIARREDVATAARKRDSPSAGGMDSALRETQKEDHIDAIYNGRPIELTAPPIEIYHPVFAKFRREISVPIDKASFSPDELEQASDLVTNSLAFYEDEIDRVVKISNQMRALVHDNVLNQTGIIWDNGRTFTPDGSIFASCRNREPGVTAFIEVKNGIGEGLSDPIYQAQCDYVLYYSGKDRRGIRLACCCPAFLIGIAGPFMIISGAVFADRFISQHLTEYIFLGGMPYLNKRLYEIARVFKALRLCLTELKGFYAGIDPPTLPNPRPSLFPHFSCFKVDGRDFELEYIKRIPQHFKKAVFKATIQLDGRAHPVVVKFTPTYCARAHQVVYEMHSAPKLWFCEVVESVGMFVVVMDFVDGHQIDDDRPRLPPKALGTLRNAISALHGQNLVHGNLRGQNLVVCNDTKRAMLLDFDWAGYEGEVLYPADINMELMWHEDVQPGARISHAHDAFMLRHWGT